MDAAVDTSNPPRLQTSWIEIPSIPVIDADNLAAGNPTVRITWERLTETGAREAYRLRQIMARLRAG